MHQVGITRMDKKDEDLAYGLQKVGIDRVQSLVLVGVLRLKDAKARGIETITGLRQPEVSIGMKNLMERGWVKEIPNAETKLGKGRPEKLYKLDIQFDAILAEIEVEVKLKSEKAAEKIFKLRGLAKRSSS